MKPILLADDTGGCVGPAWHSWFVVATPQNYHTALRGVETTDVFATRDALFHPAFPAMREAAKLCVVGTHPRPLPGLHEVDEL
jgi:hypothetical protein